MEIVITNAAVLSYWGTVKNTVWVNDERFGHIQEHHPDDFDYYRQFIAAAILSPVLILDDCRNERTAMFIGQTGREGINVIVKLARFEDEKDRSFVVTMYPVGYKRLCRLARTHPVIYGKLPQSAESFKKSPLHDGDSML